MSEQKWTRIDALPPPDGEVVWTKIDDGRGVRNVQTLRRRGNLFWFPNGHMYIYYEPTHWRPLDSDGGTDGGQ